MLAIRAVPSEIPGVELRTGDGIVVAATKVGNQEVSPMSGAKQTSTRKRRRKAMPVLGAAGLLALASGASAEAPADTSTPDTRVSHQVFLGEEEISDVSLATFYVFDKENAGSLKPGVQLARGGCGGGGCGCGYGSGGGGCRGCGGFGGAFSSLADEPFAEDDGELGLGLKPFTRRSFSGATTGALNG
jgi:hypothetical protein